MKKSTIVAEFKSPIEKVWDVVTNNNEFEWRSDLSNIVISDNINCFTEITKDGYETEFTITVVKKLERYEFDMKYKNMQGHWIGTFKVHNGKTRIEFTEEIEVKNYIMKVFIGGFLRKQQALYISDLKKALGE